MPTAKRPLRAQDLQQLAELMNTWPASWAGFNQDEAPGARLVAALHPFIVSLAEAGLAAKTVRRHADNLWAIGGEVVRRFHDEPQRRRKSARHLLLDAVGYGEAPLLSSATEADQKAADATARKLLKFLTAK